MVDRLKRLDWVYAHSPLYFVTTCTADRKHLLANSGAHETFKDFCIAGRERGVWVGAYVFMPDHLHLFVALDDERLFLSEWIKALKGALSAHFRTKGWKPPYWQKGFFDHVLRSAESYSEKWEYVRANPVRAGLVKSPEDWPYLGEINALSF